MCVCVRERECVCVWRGRARDRDRDRIVCVCVCVCVCVSVCVCVTVSCGWCLSWVVCAQHTVLNTLDGFRPDHPVHESFVDVFLLGLIEHPLRPVQRVEVCVASGLKLQTAKF